MRSETPRRVGPIAALVLVMLAAGSIGATAAGWHGPARAVGRTPSTATVDDTGTVHVVSESGQGLRYTTNRTGEWKTVRLSRGGSDREPSIALSGGKVFIAYARIGDSAETNGARSVGIYLVTNRTGAWTTTQLTNNEGVWPWSGSCGHDPHRLSRAEGRPLSHRPVGPLDRRPGLDAIVDRPLGLLPHRHLAGARQPGPRPHRVLP